MRIIRCRASTTVFIVSLSAFAVLFTPRVAALNWPVAHAVLTATFGASRWNHFSTGIDIGGGAQAVHPAAGGSVIFRFDEGQDPRDVPTGLGSFIVLQHPDGLRTLYAHFAKGTILESRANVTSQDTLGITGDTGDSAGTHLFFSVIDPAKDEYINPLTLLPPLPDTMSPVIASVSLERNKKLVPVENGMQVPAGAASLVAEVFDLSQYVNYYDPMAPYEIDAVLNGKQLFKITYQTLKSTNGSLVLLPSDGSSFSNYYVSAWGVRLGEVTLAPGLARLVVQARDTSGNVTEKAFELNVLPAGSAGSSDSSGGASPRGAPE